MQLGKNVFASPMPFGRRRRGCSYVGTQQRYPTLKRRFSIYLRQEWLVLISKVRQDKATLAEVWTERHFHFGCNTLKWNVHEVSLQVPRCTFILVGMFTRSPYRSPLTAMRPSNVSRMASESLGGLMSWLIMDSLTMTFCCAPLTSLWVRCTPTALVAFLVLLPLLWRGWGLSLVLLCQLVCQMIAGSAGTNQRALFWPSFSAGIKQRALFWPSLYATDWNKFLFKGKKNQLAS